MFWKILKGMAGLSVLACALASGYLFVVGDESSYLCSSARYIKETAPIAPIPIGFCGAVDPVDPRNLPPPVVAKSADNSIYFKRTTAYGEHPYKETIEINPGCQFDPVGETYKSNTHLTFVNNDQRPHTIVAERPANANVAFANFHSPEIAPGEEYKLFINQVGDFTYYCQDQPGGRGTFVVIEW
jgi:plastocyanin